MTNWSIIDAAFPYRGKCGMCGCADARHRLFDAMRGNHRAGDDPERIATAYAAPLRGVLEVLAPKRTPLRRKVRT